MDKLTQVILVSRTGSHEDIVTAAATASLTTYADKFPDEVHQPHAWDAWLSARFTKSVRTVKSDTHLDRARDWAAEEDLDLARVDVGAAIAVALAPADVVEMPKFIRSARVAGLDRESAPQPPRVRAPVQLHVLESLSTGKAAAQAAHALWMAYLNPHGLDLDAWTESGCLFNLHFVTAAQLAATPGLEVIDSGLTEITPGTLTAKAVRAP